MPRPNFTLLDITRGGATDVEGPHRQLRSRFADRLRGNDAHGESLFNDVAVGEIHAVAELAHAKFRSARQRTADLDLLDTHLLDLASLGLVDQVILADDHIVGDRVDDVGPADTSTDRVCQAHLDFFSSVNHPLGDSLGRPAIRLGDHHVLADVGQLAGQVATVGSLQRRVGQSLAGPVRGTEILQDRESLAEVRLDRRLDDLTRRLGHQATHASQLPDLLDTTTGTRVGHQEDRVDVAFFLGTVIVLELTHHLLGDPLASMGPLVKHRVVAFLVGDDPATVELLLFFNLFLGQRDHVILVVGCSQVGGGKREPAVGRLLEPQGLHPVQQADRIAPAEVVMVVTVGDDIGQVLALHRQVVVGHLRIEDVVEEHPTDGRVQESTGTVVLWRLRPNFLLGREAKLDPGVSGDAAKFQRHENFCRRGELHVLAGTIVLGQGQVVAAHHNVLAGTDDRGAVGRGENVVGREHQRGGFDLSLDRQWQVHRHLIAVEVRVEPLADQRVNPNRIPFDQRRFESLDPHSVQGRCPVEQHRVVGDHFIENVPDIVVLPLEHPFGALDRVGMAEFFEATDHEGLEQLQGDLLGQATLVEFQFGANDDHRPGRIVDPLAEQVFTEPPLLALDHVGQALQRTIRRPQHGSLAPVVVKECVDRLLQHPLFVADDDLRSIQVDQLLEPVVPIDDPTIEIVEIAGGEIARIEQDQRAEIRRDHGNHIKHHPVGTILAVPQRLDDLQPLDQVLLLLLAAGFLQLGSQLR